MSAHTSGGWSAEGLETAFLPEPRRNPASNAVQDVGRQWLTRDPGTRATSLASAPGGSCLPSDPWTAVRAGFPGAPFERAGRTPPRGGLAALSPEQAAHVEVERMELRRVIESGAAGSGGVDFVAVLPARGHRVTSMPGPAAQGRRSGATHPRTMRRALSISDLGTWISTGTGRGISPLGSPHWRLARSHGDLDPMDAERSTDRLGDAPARGGEEQGLRLARSRRRHASSIVAPGPGHRLRSSASGAKAGGRRRAGTRFRSGRPNPAWRSPSTARGSTRRVPSGAVRRGAARRSA